MSDLTQLSFTREWIADWRRNASPTRAGRLISHTAVEQRAELERWRDRRGSDGEREECVQLLETVAREIGHACDCLDCIHRKAMRRR